MRVHTPKSQALLNLLGALAVSLCWGIGGPLTWIATQHLPAAETAWGRCFFAFLGLLPFFLLDGKKIVATLDQRGRRLLASCGLLLGLHFYLFVAGVAHASLSTAVTLVAVEPVLVLLIGVFGFKEALRPGSLYGILLCMTGVIVISILPHLWVQQSAHAPGKLYGDVCAVLAVVSYGFYYALNRAFRPHQETLLREHSAIRRSFGLASVIYFFAMFSSGMLVLASHATAASSAPLQLPSGQTLLALIVMGLIPTMIGHALNQSMSRTAHPIWISMMSPGETFMALLIGYFFLGQVMGPFEALGGLLILMGVFLAAWSETRQQQTAVDPSTNELHLQ